MTMKLSKERIPLPKNSRIAGRYERLMRDLEIEDCVEHCTRAEAQGLRVAAIKLGMKVTQRQQSRHLFRVWRIE